MVEKRVSKHELKDSANAVLRDLSYWLSRTPDERISLVERLRQQYGNTSRLQRVARVTKLSQS
jgi:hypothetical protein